MAQEVVRLQGLRRLVELCKCESARVASDGVLVACLAAVRKVILYDCKINNLMFIRPNLTRNKIVKALILVATIFSVYDYRSLPRLVLLRLKKWMQRN